MGSELIGKIYVYDAEKGLKAYSNGVESSTKIIFVGGHGCNLLIKPFTIFLSEYCLKNGYEFIMPQLRSQPDFGLFTIDDDVKDLNRLLKKTKGDVVLIGNSTGCQDILYYLKKIGKKNIRLAVLQGAVSDVEYEEHTNSDLGELLAKVQDMSSDIAFKYNDKYITPERFLDVFSRNGKEDMFSSYLGDEFFKALNVTGIKILFVISGKDKYGIKDIRSKLQLVENSRVETIPNGSHMLKDKEDIELFLELCDEEIKKALNKN